MANNFSISGAQKNTNVATSAALIAAITAAKAGEVITLTATVAPFILTLNQPKPSPGISVVLPQDQQVAIVGAAANLNTEIVGGYITNKVAGVGNNYSLSLGASSRMAFRGGTIGSGGILTQGTLAADFVIADMLVEWAEVDFFQLSACNRFQLLRLFGRNMVKGQKIKWFDDGRAPVDNVGAPSPQNATNGWWDDTAHNDAAQIRSNATALNSPIGGPSSALPSTDFLIDDLDLHVLGAGVVHFDYNPYSDLGLPSMVRGRIQNSTLLVVDPGAVSMRGEDMQAYNVTVGPHPTDPGPGTIYFRLMPTTDGGPERVRGGNNSNPGGLFYTPAGVTITGAAQGAVDVVDPTPPAFGLNRLPWAPAVTRPAYSPWTAAPQIVQAPKLYWTVSGTPYKSTDSSPPPPVIGSHVTVGQGTTKGFEGSTGEYRWTRNDTPITGETARTYQVVGADSATTLRCETRRSNGFGTGAWVASAGLVIA